MEALPNIVRDPAIGVSVLMPSGNLVRGLTCLGLVAIGWARHQRKASVSNRTAPLLEESLT